MLIDPSYPEDRFEYAVESSKCNIVLTSRLIVEQLTWNKNYSFLFVDEIVKSVVVGEFEIFDDGYCTQKFD